MKMKHIDIVQNYSGVTEMIADGQLSPNFLVKSENDQKVYFSNAAGLRLVVDSGNTYNMYSVGANSFEADFSSTSGFSFRILGADNQYLTANFDWDAEAMEGGTVISQDSGSTQNENHFVLSWGYGDTSWQVVYDPVNNLVQVTGSYTLTDEEACTYHGGTWDPVNQECVMPTCSERGLCGDDPYNCHECTCEEQYEEGSQEKCECEGRYWYGDACHDEPEPGPEDPCDTCVDVDGDQTCCECAGGTWEDDGEGNYSCVFSQDNCDWWERNGYSSYEDCMCQNFGTDCEEEGCNGDPECECNEQGGTWDGENCNFDEGE